MIMLSFQGASPISPGRFYMRNPLVLFWEGMGSEKVGEVENIIITYCGTVLAR